MEVLIPGEEDGWRQWKCGKKTDEAKGMVFLKCLKNAVISG